MENNLIECLKNGWSADAGSLIVFDSHDKEEYCSGLLLGTSRYSSPCRWQIEAVESGYVVVQYDLSVNRCDIASQYEWLSSSIEGREIFGPQHMTVVHFETTPKGATNVYMRSTEVPSNILILLIVSDHIEKIQFVDQNTEKQTIYRSAVEKICSLGLEEKKAIVQMGYQLIASASPCGRVTESDDESIDVLLDGCFFLKAFGNVVWNQATNLNPYEAFKIVSQLDESAKAAIKLVLVNVARVDNVRLRFDILRQICVQASLPRIDNQNF